MKLVDQNWFNLKKSFKEDGIVVQLDTKWAFLVICFLLQWTRIERVKPMKGKTDYLAQGKRLKKSLHEIATMCGSGGSIY